MKNLTRIQKELKAPKGQFNNFGKYKYRSCEDILEAVKPLLKDCLLTISDEMVLIGDRIYVKATAEFTDGDYVKTVSGFARESESKKGMDASQITGSASSYARKIALNGLFLIDDNKDVDAGKSNGDSPVNKDVAKFEIVVDEFTDAKELASKSESLIKNSKIKASVAKKIIRTKYEALK